jgi:hypothetical protein
MQQGLWQGHLSFQSPAGDNKPRMLDCFNVQCLHSHMLVPACPTCTLLT